MKTKQMIAALTITVGLLTSATAWALAPNLNAKTLVAQTTCGETVELPFAYLSHFEKRLLTTAVEIFNGEGDTQAAGCWVTDESVGCEGFGYVCWVQVLPGGPGEPDVYDYGCGKETC